MITKLESLSRRGSLEQVPSSINEDAQPGSTSSIREGSSEGYLTVDSPPAYDDSNYIPSPIYYEPLGSSIEPLLLIQDGPSEVSEPVESRPGSSSVADSTDLETERGDALHELERNMSALQAARTRAAQPKQVDTEEIAREVVRLEEAVLENMCQLAVLQPNSQLRAEWRGRAETFMRTMSSFQRLGPQPQLQIEPMSETDSDTHIENREPVGSSNADENDIEIDKEEGTSVPLTLSKRVKRMYCQIKSDKGAVFIVKGTAGIFVLHCAAPAVLLAASVYVVYGAGKGVAHLGRKVVKVRKGSKVPNLEAEPNMSIPPPSETPTKPPRDGKLRRKH